jgi:E3 ubiquitin-protein ligase FANCL
MVIDEPSASPPRLLGWVQTTFGLHAYSLEYAAASRGIQVNMASLRGDIEFCELYECLRGKSWFQERLSSCKTLEAVGKELQDIVTEMVETKKYMDISKPNELQSRIGMPDSNDSLLPLLMLKQIQKLGWEHLVSMNHDMTKLVLRTWDSSNRVHEFDVQIPVGYPTVAPIVAVALPCGMVQIPWNLTIGSSTNDSDLTTVLQTVNNQVSKYEKLFDALTRIDEGTWVLEPSKPTFAITKRRIVIDKSCSLILDINPDNPFAPCEMSFFGPPTKIDELRSALSVNISKWLEEYDIKSNIESVLNIKLPLKDESQNDEYLVECSICYSYSLDTDESNSLSKNTPDQVCNNTKCNRMYHTSCLIDWLQSIPTTRTSFGTLFGTCVYCQEPIAVKCII